MKLMRKHRQRAIEPMSRAVLHKVENCVTGGWSDAEVKAALERTFPNMTEGCIERYILMARTNPPTRGPVELSPFDRAELAKAPSLAFGRYARFRAWLERVGLLDAHEGWSDLFKRVAAMMRSQRAHKE